MDTRLPKFIQEAHRLDPSLASNMIDSPEDKQGQRWPITTRPATLSDLPSITNIALTSSSTEPSFAWKFPQHKQFPQDVYNHIRHEYRTYLEIVDWVVVVGEVPAVYANGMRSRREEVEEVEMMTIAVAVWNISALPPPDEEYVAQMSENCAEKAQENQQSCESYPV